MPDSAYVRAAFYCIHHHLEEYLSDEDKHILGFNPIFTEYLLCKVVRWAKHLSTEGDINFYDMGYKAEQNNFNWVAGANKTDPAAFPFPLQIDNKNIEKMVKDAAVRVCFMYLHQNLTVCLYRTSKLLDTYYIWISSLECRQYQ
jgi:hypothetical protein